MTLHPRIASVRIRRAPHRETRTVPPRFVVHQSTRGNGRWEMHEKGSPYCALTNPGWTGDSNCGCLGTSFPATSWSRAVAEAHRRVVASRTRFFAEMQARGRYTS